MRALLDVNVLLALLDSAHVFHQRARDWLVANAPSGWASCPITENGFVRVISQPGYPKPIKTSQAIALLKSATGTPLHEFWPADVSLLQPSVLDASRVHGPRQLTDLYLLALAVAHGGRLATFDGAIAVSAARGATAHHIVII